MPSITSTTPTTQSPLTGPISSTNYSTITTSTTPTSTLKITNDNFNIKDSDLNSKKNNKRSINNLSEINDQKYTSKNFNARFSNNYNFNYNKDRETHHRHSYDLSSSLSSSTTTSNGCSNHPIINTKNCTNKNSTNYHHNHSYHANNSTTNYPKSKLSTSKDYENLLKQFEKLKSKADTFGEKDPEFIAKLLNFANKISNKNSYKLKMDAYYASTYYPQSSVYSTHSTFNPPTSNIYSSFNNSNIFSSSYHHHHHHQQPSAPPSNPPPPPPPRPPPIPPHSQNINYTSSSNKTSSNSKTHSKHSSSNNTSSKNKNNYSRYSYDNSTFNSPYSNSRHSSNIYSQYFNYTYPNDKQYSYSFSYHNQDTPEDLLLILENPYDSNKITVQMTRTQLGPNGEQQRVTVERDFKSEAELNKFLKEFEENLNKNIQPDSTTKSSSYTNLFGQKNTDQKTDDLIKSPGVVVVEEPGEEPKLYRQDTGELVTNGVFIDPFLTGENDEHPNDLPKTKEKAKYASENSSKLYRDIDELLEKLKNETKLQNESMSKNEFKNEDKSMTNDDISNSSQKFKKESKNVESEFKSEKVTSHEKKDFINEHQSELKEAVPKLSKNSNRHRTIRRAESYLHPKLSNDLLNKTETKSYNKDTKIQRPRSTSIKKTSKHQQGTNEKDFLKKPNLTPEMFSKFDKLDLKNKLDSKEEHKENITYSNKTNSAVISKQTKSNIEKSPRDEATLKSKVRVINMNHKKIVTCKRTASLSENLNTVFSNTRLFKETKTTMLNNLNKKEFQSSLSTQYKHKYEKPLLSTNARLGGEPANLKRHASLLYPKSSLPRSESTIDYDKNKSKLTPSLNHKSEQEPVVESRDKNENEKLVTRRTELKTRFSLRENRSNKVENEIINRRYSQVYEKNDSDISTILEEGKREENQLEEKSKQFDKKHKLLNNHHLITSKKLSKSVDTGLSEEQKLKISNHKSKYIEKELQKKKLNDYSVKVEKFKVKNENFSIKEEEDWDINGVGTESEDYETAEVCYENEESYNPYSVESDINISDINNKNSSSINHLNQDYYNFDSSQYGESGQFYSNLYYRSQQSPAYFQPNYFQKTSSRSKLQQSSQQLTQERTNQHSHHQNCYRNHSYRANGYYASWYGSAPSLQVQQSVYFNN